MNFDRGIKLIQEGKDSIFNMVLGKLDTQMQKN